MANKKITDLNNLATPNGDDVMAIVDDVAGTPTTKKVTVSNLMTQAPVQTADISGFATTVSLGNHESLTSTVHGISAFGATLVDDADAATARTTLGVPYISSGTDANLPSNPSTADVHLETNTGRLRWWDGTYWNTFNYDSQYDPNYASNQLGYSGGLFSSTNYNISVQPEMHFDAAILDGSDAANNPSHGGSVSTWGDRSGNASNYDLSQATGSNQATFDTQTEGKISLEFTSGDYYSIGTNYTGSTSGNYTVVYVAKIPGSTNGTLLYAPLSNGNSPSTIWFNGGIYGDLVHGSTSKGFTSGGDPSGTALPTAFNPLHLYIVQRTSNTAVGYTGGNNQEWSYASVNAAVTISEFGQASSTYTTAGNIFEVMFFDSALSTTDLNTITSYVGNKYGITTTTF